ncbi:MAG: TonB-dependent receptor [Flavobacteriales bacterium CG03_land_8_20_14_0_80_35_15]|nr:MAG: TonB-dependent receptor [Flavobacteriales bacterium CG03_land_8_20_14_0_80_35_15]
MKIKILLFISFISSIAFAQHKISGTVKDSIGNPLEMANVIAINQTTKALESYFITDDKGFYKINLSNNDIFELSVSYIGFATQIFVVKTATLSGDLTKDFVLKENNNKLNEVELTYDMPITIKGDTMVYNADSFTNGKEKKLGDVLKKLPGVEINSNDEVEVDGKKVSKIMVDGKDFFDGDSKLATKNIPADAVSKIEVLKNYNDVSQMKGLGNDDDNIALNIKLKQGKKNFWFGEITAGGGPDNRYLAHPKLFYYSPKKSVNIITDFNNVGEIPFTFRDYFNFTGGLKNMNRRSGTNFNLNSNSLGLALLKDNKAQAIETKFSALNFSFAPNKVLDLSGFAIYSGTNTIMQTNTQITTQTPTFNNVENQQSVSRQLSQLGLLKLSSTYKPNRDFQLDFDAFLKKSNLEEYNTIKSITSFNGINHINIDKNDEPFSINQNLNGYFTLNAKNIFSFATQFTYDKDNPLYHSLNSDQRFAVLPTITEVDNQFDLTQIKSLITNKFDVTIDYYYVLNDKSNLNLTLGSSINNQNLNTHIFQTLQNKSIVDFNDATLNNRVNFDFNDLYLGLHYKVKTGAFTLSPGIKIHQFNYKNAQLSSSLKQNPTKILPDFFAKFDLKQSENITFNYDATTNFTDVNNLAEGLFLLNYNALFLGNKNLTNTLYQNYTLKYFNFNMFSFTNMFATLNYSKKYRSIKSNTNLIGIDRISTTINASLPEDSFSANIRYSKRFRKFKTDASSNFFLSNTNNIINNEVSHSQSITQNYQASLATNFKVWPNITLGYQTTINKYEATTINSTYTTDRPFAELELPFLKSFNLLAKYSYYNYRDKANTVKNNYTFLDADLLYQKEKSKWEFKISATNLLNTSSLNQDSFSEYITNSSQYFIAPRYILASFKYNL